MLKQVSFCSFTSSNFDFPFDLPYFREKEQYKYGLVSYLENKKGWLYIKVSKQDLGNHQIFMEVWEGSGSQFQHPFLRCKPWESGKFHYLLKLIRLSTWGSSIIWWLQSDGSSEAVIYCQLVPTAALWYHSNCGFKWLLHC